MFMSLFTPALIDHIVLETSRFAALCLRLTYTGEGPPPVWETEGVEIQAYHGFAILLGFNKVPDLYDYWSTNPIFHHFPVASRIPRRRFLETQCYFHFSDDDAIFSRGEPVYDRLAKVRPVINAIHQSFLTSYQLHGECN